MAHTKGPWEIIKAQRGFVIAAKDGMYDIAVVRDIGNEGNEENARLIAAAPDLLEALQSVIEDNSYYFPEGNPWGDKARAAIKKATS